MTVPATDHGLHDRAQNSVGIHPPKPPTAKLADLIDDPNLTVPAPPSVERYLRHTIDDDAQIGRLILGRRTGHEQTPSLVVETPEDRAALDRRAAEDHRGGLTLRNKRLRDRADRIGDTAPAATCYRTAVHRTTTEISGSRVKCNSWGCLHCSKTKTARILSEFVELFGHRDRVCTTPHADDDARRRYKNRLGKHNQRTGLDVGAMVIPVAGSGFLSIGTYRDPAGEMFSIEEAFDLLAEALESRSDIARLTGTALDKRRISRPGLEPVRDSAKDEITLVRTNADKAEDRRLVGLILREVSSADLAGLVARHNGKRGGHSRKNRWSYRFECETDADAFVADLERLWDLRTEEELTETRTERSNRIAWENEMTAA